MTDEAAGRALTPAEIAKVDFSKLRRTCDMCQCFNPAPMPADAPADYMPRGQCRRNPPKLTQILLPSPPHPITRQPQGMTDLSLCGWPLVGASDWCIEGFLPIPEANQ